MNIPVKHQSGAPWMISDCLIIQASCSALQCWGLSYLMHAVGVTATGVQGRSREDAAG